jgi:hypothetical protein
MQLRPAVSASGSGAWLDGRKIVTGSDEAPTAALKGAVLRRFLPETFARHVASAGPRFAELSPGTGCAGADFAAMVTGIRDFTLYWRTLPWDHAPRVLFVREAGGAAQRLDGSPYPARSACPAWTARGPGHCHLAPGSRRARAVALTHGCRDQGWPVRSDGHLLRTSRLGACASTCRDAAHPDQQDPHRPAPPLTFAATLRLAMINSSARRPHVLRLVRTIGNEAVAPVPNTRCMRFVFGMSGTAYSLSSGRVKLRIACASLASARSGRRMRASTSASKSGS